MCFAAQVNEEAYHIMYNYGLEAHRSWQYFSASIKKKIRTLGNNYEQTPGQFHEYYSLLFSSISWAASETIFNYAFPTQTSVSLQYRSTSPNKEKVGIIFSMHVSYILQIIINNFKHSQYIDVEE